MMIWPFVGSDGLGMARDRDDRDVEKVKSEKILGICIAPFTSTYEYHDYLQQYT